MLHHYKKQSFFCLAFNGTLLWNLVRFAGLNNDDPTFQWSISRELRGQLITRAHI